MKTIDNRKVNKSMTANYKLLAKMQHKGQ